jgi:hypothetical protein
MEERDLESAASGAPDSVRCTRSARNEPATLENSMGALRYNSPDCPVCTGLSSKLAEQQLPARQWSTAECTVVNSAAQKLEHRSQRS